MTQAQIVRRIVKPLVFAASLVPAGILVYRFLQDALGPNPISEALNVEGDWTIRFVVFTLCITPLRKITGVSSLIDLRRMVGLFAFFYGSMHFLTYILLDQALDLNDILADIAKRPFIMVGFASFVMMIPLALTSTKGWIKRLGGKKWNLLHRLIYLTAVGGVIHYYWRVKADVRPPLMYGFIVLVLFGLRMWFAYRKKGTTAKPTRPASAKAINNAALE